MGVHTGRAWWACTKYGAWSGTNTCIGPMGTMQIFHSSADIGHIYFACHCGITCYEQSLQIIVSADSPKRTIRRRRWTDVEIYFRLLRIGWWNRTRWLERYPLPWKQQSEDDEIGGSSDWTLLESEYASAHPCTQLNMDNTIPRLHHRYRGLHHKYTSVPDNNTHCYRLFFVLYNYRQCFFWH